MKLLLSKDVKGVNTNTKETRLHASAGDVLFVLLRRIDGSFICESKYYPEDEVVVFKGQIKEIISDDIPSNEEHTEGDDILLDFDMSDTGESEE